MSYPKIFDKEILTISKGSECVGTLLSLSCMTSLIDDVTMVHLMYVLKGYSWISIAILEG